MLQSFIAQKPRDPFPRYALALEYKNAGRLDDAHATFAELIAVDPNYVATYLHAGNVLLALGRREDARTTYQSGIAAATRASAPSSSPRAWASLASLG